MTSMENKTQTKYNLLTLANLTVILYKVNTLSLLSSLPPLGLMSCDQIFLHHFPNPQVTISHTQASLL